MKKTLAIIAAIVMALTATAALAEEPAKPTFSGGVAFAMDMNQVLELMKAMENVPAPEIDDESIRGVVTFTELEYNNVSSYDGFTTDMKYYFVEDALVAIRYDFAKGTSYDQVKQALTGFGEAVPFDGAALGNAKYFIDDDGDLKDCKEMIVGNGVTIVLEQDNDGDVDVTFLDPIAAYI